MHGCNPGFTLLVNAEVDSMGGVVDCEVGLDSQSSPHRAAIAKTQEELRLEYDVREERRRELEFLEKGGNPLDYKFGRATSISVQSTSLRDQLAEQHVTSEAKGSFALATSPHGDSVESSGRPAGSMGREPNIADNLLLFSGENCSPGREKNVRRTGRRSNAAPAEQSSKIDGCRNAKESNDLVILRLEPGGQAYARRNRYRSSRDSHSSKSPLLSSSHTDARDVKESHEEVQEHTVSSIINSKPTHFDKEKTELQLVKINACENLKNFDYNSSSAEQADKQTPDFIGKESIASVGFLSAPPCDMDNIKGSNHDEKDKNFRALDVAHEDNITGKENVSSNITEMVGRKNADMSTAHLHGSADSSDSLTYRVGVSVGLNSKGQVAGQVTSGTGSAAENSQIAGSAAAYITRNGEARTQIKFNNSVQVKDEVQLCNKNDEQAVDRVLSNTEIRLNKKLEIPQDVDKTGTIIVNSNFHSHEPSLAIPSRMVCSTAPEPQNSEAIQLKLAKRANEDAILKEARIIETNLKRASVPSISCFSSEKQRKTHWNFVLEEMAWMANDFMQERLWKTTAAAQVCHWIASVGRSKFEQENLCQKQRNVARKLAKAVRNFWKSVGAILTKGEASSGMKEDGTANLFKASNISSFNTVKDQSVEVCGGPLKPGLQSYARRILQYLSDVSSDPILAEAPRTPDRLKDTGSFGVFLDDQLSEENLFYKVLPGAMHSYRESIESQCAQIKEEECEASMCDSIADGRQIIAFEEDEGETATDIFSGALEGNYLPKYIHKNRKIYQQNFYATRYEADVSYDPSIEGKTARHTLIMRKRPSGILNVSAVPTKRTRTAARQRTISPFSSGPVGSIPMTSKTDVSSGDTGSFQDDQSSRHGYSLPQRNFEADSTVDFERLLTFDSTDIPIKPKKKKKPKHLGYKSSLNLPDSKRLQADYMVQQDQRDHTKKRCEGLQFESNGNMGFYGQNISKKLKLSKRAESPETMTPAGRSMPSPVASQMSNMSNSNKLIRIISNRDKGRKSKALKIAGGQSGPGIAWSTFEDQALVVLVHDMGLNWELISDALNSTLHFKCIYRKPIDCKERHKFLMDKSVGDGADSAEDSGSSQPYPSTLPGIPKGSARQLFQRLQGPMEEDTMKSHFEKIILIGQRLRSCRSQDNKQLIQITPVHSSHLLALSQACPNNLSGTILSPVDLADAVNSNTDSVALVHQGSHTNGIVIPGHQASLAPVLSTSSTNAMLQGSPSMVLGSGLPPPSPLHAPPRDSQRYGVHRSSTLPVEDQKRLQQYNQNFSGRNVQQSGISMTNALPVGVDRGVRMLPGGNGMGMMCGVNRSMSMPRTGFQSVSAAGMLNMVSPNNMLSGNVSSPGSTMLRPRDALQMLRPGQTTEETRQIMMQEIQLQASQGNAQAIAPFNGMSGSFSNASVPPPVQTMPLQQHQPHQIPQQPHILGSPNNSLIQGTNHSSSQQQAYIRFAKESQLQQRIMPQAQHPYSGSSAISPMENNSQFQQQNQSSSPVNSVASSQTQHKQQPMPRNPQTSSTVSSQIIKQRQRQQVQQQQQQQQQQQPRNLQQQKQQAQHGKLMKGLGRGTMLLQQNLSVDANQGGIRPTVSSNQASEKLLLQQNQGFSPVSAGLNSNLQQPSISQQLYSRPHPPQSKQVASMPSHPDNNQASIRAPSTHSIRTVQHSVPATPPATQQQQQQRQANQSPTNMQRIMIPQSRQSSHDGRIQSINEPVQVNQMIPSSSLPKTSDSSSLPGVISSGVHWKPEPSFETCTTGEKAQIAAIPQENFTGNDAMIPPSTQGLGQRQLSGNISMHVHGVGGQWQQQQQLQPTPLTQQQHRQGVQGNLYTRSSNTGP
ncbi:chromatin modification-related protein EAF1 B-like isoform X2 [Phalaenopsis equestris]|uniref:chromatin modification-related protein EAF1 B-like isoform X2 n=1 Tax=Phalaenopsis equestris TaxID=78828 RepID=UPI0009E1D108|nr:chromatin modification-related protein EAF1 B-like isoform X2 [Phalaenopsis equestris]